MAGRHRDEEMSSVVSKVPEVTAYFWIAKVLTTALGESTSDYLVHEINPYLAVGVVLASASVMARSPWSGSCCSSRWSGTWRRRTRTSRASGRRRPSVRWPERPPVTSSPLVVTGCRKV
jgi:Repeat of Unknown Function (DUF347)